MTMVLAAMTDDHIFVVSDRRMTNAITQEVMSSTENKAVVLNDQAILTYTGFCNLEGLPTDAWVANILAKEPVANWLKTILNRVGPAVRQVRVSAEMRKHAFLLTGYMPALGRPRPFRPVGFLISNFHDPHGKILEKPESQFWLSILRMGNWKVRIDSIGRDLSDHRRLALEKAIRLQLRATPDKPQRVLDILGNEIRRVAQGDLGVGQDLMAVSFPHAAVGSGLNIAIDPSAVDWRKQLVAFYAGIDSPMVTYGPTYVGRSVQMFGMSVSHDPTNLPAAEHRLSTKRDK